MFTGIDPIINLTSKELGSILKNPVKSAEAVNLVYVKDIDPGIKRIKKGKTFQYLLKNRQLNRKSTDFLANSTDFVENPADFLRNPTDILKNSSDVLKNPAEFLKNPTDFKGNPTDVVENPADFLKHPTEPSEGLC